MRRYNKLSGILLILSIIDFALAAPVLVQEKRQVRVDALHVPRDVIAVLGKRGPGDEELEKLAEEYFVTSGKPVESSDAHASSSSAPPGPDHGSSSSVPPGPDHGSSSPVPPEPNHGSWGSVLPGPDHGSSNVVQAPAPNPASTTANPNRLMEPSSPSSSSSSEYSDDEWWYEGDGNPRRPLSTSTSSESGLNHELTGAHTPQPNPNPGPSTDSVVHPPTSSGSPPPNPELTDPELNFDHLSLSTNSQPVEDPQSQAAIYAVKGKGKESRRISGTARDVGNAAKREWLPNERSLDPGE